MIAMQYKIILPPGYDMNTIKTRVANDGHQMDGFEDLKYKFYLITQKGEYGAAQNSYCPLYLWKDSGGMNKFLFNGFYDTIIGSFGWQKVRVGIPLIEMLSENLKDYSFLIEKTGGIKPRASLQHLEEEFAQELKVDGAEYFITYNPDMWTYGAYYLLDEPAQAAGRNGSVYRILHISREKQPLFGFKTPAKC